MPEEINLLKEEYKKVSEYFENRIYGTYKEDNFDRIGKYSLDDLVNTLTELTKNSEVNEKDDLLRQIKSYNSRNKSLSEEIKDLINQEDYSVEKLPIEAQQKVVSIKELVEKLNNEKVTQFFNERLPVILKKYVSIDEEYRINLKNVEGFNAQELMLQSLENIEKIILAKKEDNNIDLITEMSVENRKLKYKTIN